MSPFEQTAHLSPVILTSLSHAIALKFKGYLSRLLRSLNELGDSTPSARERVAIFFNKKSHQNSWSKTA